MGTIHIGKRVAGDPSERLSIIFDPGTEGYNIVPATLTGQLLGYYKSLALGLDPDNPSTSGAISRVVQGVILYGTDHSHNDL
jgi:tagatose-6-phosphate ketose/aldose isomerase